jgi:hypothetical protein
LELKGVEDGSLTNFVSIFSLFFFRLEIIEKNGNCIDLADLTLGETVGGGGRGKGKESTDDKTEKEIGDAGGGGGGTLILIRGSTPIFNV